MCTGAIRAGCTPPCTQTAKGCICTAIVCSNLHAALSSASCSAQQKVTRNSHPTPNTINMHHYLPVSHPPKTHPGQASLWDPTCDSSSSNQQQQQHRAAATSALQSCTKRICMLQGHSASGTSLLVVMSSSAQLCRPCHAQGASACS
jgi:hypothetical protein